MVQRLGVRRYQRTSITEWFQVVTWEDDTGKKPRQIWRLIPVKADGVSTPSVSLSNTLGSEPPPSHDGSATEQFSTCTCAQRTESECDELGTVNEVTVVTTTVTTRRRYRPEDA